MVTPDFLWAGGWAGKGLLSNGGDLLTFIVGDGPFSAGQPWLGGLPSGDLFGGGVGVSVTGQFTAAHAGGGLMDDGG